MRSPHAFRLDRIGSLAQAGGIHEPKSDAFQFDLGFDLIAGGARDIADDGAVAAHEGV